MFLGIVRALPRPLDDKKHPIGWSLYIGKTVFA